VSNVVFFLVPFACNLICVTPIRYIAVTHDAHVQVWRTPNHLIREFAPFHLHRTYTGHHNEVISIEWTPDSKSVLSFFFYLNLRYCRCFITTSRDMTARLFTLDPLEGFRPKTFAGHRDLVLRAFFSADGKSVSHPPRSCFDTAADTS
jgi:periodic tryptophan protein 2